MRRVRSSRLLVTALTGAALSKGGIHRMIPLLRPSCSDHNRRSPLGCTAPGVEPRWGIPVASYVAGLSPTPAF